MNRAVKESETVKAFRIRRREILKGAIESGCLKMNVRHRLVAFYLQGLYVGIAYGKKEIEDSLSMIANILKAFDLSKKEWAK